MPHFTETQGDAPSQFPTPYQISFGDSFSGHLDPEPGTGIEADVIELTLGEVTGPLVIQGNTPDWQAGNAPLQLQVTLAGTVGGSLTSQSFTSPGLTTNSATLAWFSAETLRAFTDPGNSGTILLRIQRDSTGTDRPLDYHLSTLMPELYIPADHTETDVLGTAGIDLIEGGSQIATFGGDDTIFVGRDDLSASAWGGAGNDLLQAAGSAGQIFHGEAGDDTLIGQSGDDSLTGGDGDDRLTGDAGNDTLEGGAGTDTLTGGDGDDHLIDGEVVNAGSGNDLVEGGTLVLAGDGNDTVRGADRALGGAGNDSLTGHHLFGNDGHDYLSGQERDDTLDGGTGEDVINGMAGNDLLFGGAGADRLNGGTGNDTLDGGAGQDTLTGGEGLDFVSYEHAGARVAVTLQDGEGALFDAEGDHYESIEGVIGSAFDDVLTGQTLGDDTLRGGAGNDILNGLSHRDLLQGEDGNDLLLGGLYEDTLEGGAGNDTLLGESGSDVVIGGLGDDVLMGGTSAFFGGDPEVDLGDRMYGGEGADRLFGMGGNDELRGDADDDLLEGGSGTDTLLGGAGQDTLTGQALSDLLFGGDGMDFINGGFGFDRVNGGAGADQFFHLGVAGHGSDWIQDYTAADGDVLMYGGGAATARDFLVQRANTANAGDAGVSEVFVTHVPSGNLLWALVDGDGQSEINVLAGGVTFDLLG